MQKAEMHYCRLCLRKDPPQHTELVAGANWKQYNCEKSIFVCNECHSEKQRDYREGRKLQFSSYLQKLHEETIADLDAQWNDPAFVKLKETSDRVRQVWDKAGRRERQKGIRRDWICEVLFPDLWFMDPTKIVDDYFGVMNFTYLQKQNRIQYLLEFVTHYLEPLREAYRNRARNRWDGIVAALNRKYSRIDKMVATPRWYDPTMKEYVENWYLLSLREDADERAASRESKKESFDRQTVNEQDIVNHREEVLRKEQEQESSQ